MSEAEPPTDADLVARCRRGDGGAWRLLVQRYQRLVYAVARRAGLDEHAAADVFQTVFSRLLEALHGISQADRVRAWIVTTAKRETWRQLRHSRRTVSMTAAPDGEAGDTADHDIADESPLPEQLLGELQQLHLLRLAMDLLDPRCRDLLGLLFADEPERLPYEEIAIRLDMPTGSIGPTRSRCLGKLRSLLEKESS